MMEKSFYSERPRSNNKSDADKSGDEVGSVWSIKLYDAACLPYLLFGWRAMVVVVVVVGERWWWWMAGNGMGGWRRCEGLENRWNE